MPHASGEHNLISLITSPQKGFTGSIEHVAAAMANIAMVRPGLTKARR
jgi:hypothetical protein